MLTKWKDSYHPYAIITILLWSITFVLTRLTLRYFSAFSLGFLRYAIASVTLLVFLAAARAKPPRLEDLKWFLAAGTAGFSYYMIAFNKGCQTVTASTGSVMLASVPVLTALLASFFYRERLSVSKWAATGIEFLGVAVLTLQGDGLSLNGGILWLSSAAISLSFYNLLQRRLTKTYSALTTCAFSIFCGTAMLSLFLPGAVRDVQEAPPVQIFYVMILGVFSSAVAYVSWSKAISKAKQMSSVSNYMFITPFLTTFLGFVIAGERPDASAAAGGAVILFGLAVFQFGDRLLVRALLRRRSGGNQQASACTEDSRVVE